MLVPVVDPDGAAAADLAAMRRRKAAAMAVQNALDEARLAEQTAHLRQLVATYQRSHSAAAYDEMGRVADQVQALTDTIDARYDLVSLWESAPGTRYRLMPDDWFEEEGDGGVLIADPDGGVTFATRQWAVELSRAEVRQMLTRIAKEG